MRVWGFVVATVVSASVVGTSAAAQKPGTAANLQALQGVNFVGSCSFSHRAPDDPIVYPRQPGKSHDHSFVGNTSTSAFSTLQSLRRSSTTCRRAGETAAYWMPTLLLNGQPVAPRGATIYYRRRTLEPLRPFPAGLRMIAGSSHAMEPQDRRIVFWNCGAQVDMRPSAEVPTCPAGRGSYLRLHVTFPSCWDGKNLDSADHQSHMAYAMRGRCPSTHPIAVPAITVIFGYPIAGGAGVSLASGGQYSGHADFFNAWNQQELRSLVNDCLNALRHCGRDT